MRVNKWMNILLTLVLLPLLPMGFTTANAGVSVTVNMGSGDPYQPVGDYDYLPYAYQTNSGYAVPRISFDDVMSQYGFWVSVSPFGHVWKPYASADWRPYSYGHWVSTQQYGQMWEGYEPWAWAGYHYGNWIYDRYYGWVWIPGYDWHAAGVSWARSNDSIGWMPLPPNGYDYSLGYLSSVGLYNQFAYDDNNFGSDIEAGNSGPYNDPRYRRMYYNSDYSRIVATLWIFIDSNHYQSDNYGGYLLGPDYTRRAFDQRAVRISNRGMDQPVLQRIIGRKIQVTPIEVMELRTDKGSVTAIVPGGDEAKFRRNCKEVVRDIIAPGFVLNRMQFQGQNSRRKDAIDRVFRQQSIEQTVDTQPAAEERTVQRPD